MDSVISHLDLNDRLSRLSLEEKALLFERLRLRKDEERRHAPEAALEATIPRRFLSAGTAPSPPLSFAQQRLWFLDRLAPDDPSYNVPLAARIEGPLDIGALRRSLDAIVARHESLRTTFGVVDGSPVQVIAPTLSFRLPVIDLEGLAAAETHRLGDELIARPFDLAAGPLLRGALIRLGRERHVLVLILHHIVSDGWSLGILVRELTTLYQEALRGSGGDLAAALPELPIQYADFAVWQRQWLSGERLEAQLAVWKRRLEGMPQVLPLPTDHPRPPVKTSSGATRWLSSTPGLGTRLQAAAREEGVTPFMLLLAVWQTLLHRYTGQEDLPVGSAVANRNRIELQGLIGLFVNTLVLRGDLSGDPPFRALLGRLRAVALEAFAHQDLPFEKLVEELRPERDPSRSPIFQVSLCLQNTPPSGADFGPDVRLEVVDYDPGLVKFDLEASFEPGLQGELHGALTYARDLFDTVTADRMARHLETLLAAALEDRSRRLSEMPLLTTEERRQLTAWNRTGARWPHRAGPAERVGEHAAARPEAAAVVAAGRVLTYGELDRKANRLAHLLRRLGAGPEVAVGVLLPRSPELVVAALAVARAGAVYLPIDLAYPEERIAGTLEDARAPVVLTLEELAERHPALGSGRTVLCLGDWIEEEMSTESPQPLGHAENLAYVIYTSGSTGRPKGVGVPRSALANLIAWHHRDLPVHPGERSTLAAGPAFDGAIWELWAFLAAGAEIHVPEEEVRLSPPRLAEWLARQRIAHSFLPTPLGEAFLAEPAAAAVPLRLLYTGGDRLHRIARRDLGFSVVNLYGPSETAVVATFEAASERERPDRDPSIGIPIANARAYVLDSRLQPLPVGVPGELWVGGETLARGYLHRPDLTAAGYRPDPFSGRAGARMYRTGDLARRRPDGKLEVLGRIDTQVKVRGLRIELGEIEAVLYGHPAVSRAVVMVRQAPGGPRLVAYMIAAAVVTPSPLSSPSPSPSPSDIELRAWLRRRLPEPMVPAAFVRLAGLPLTPAGKVDRYALARLAPPPAPERELAEPRSETERRLAAVWAEVLGCDRVGVGESFFDLGGHSLLLTRLQARLAEQLGREVPLLKLVEHPTVRALAAWLERDAPAAADGAPEPGEASRDRARRQREALAAQRQRLAQRGAR